MNKFITRLLTVSAAFMTMATSCGAAPKNDVSEGKIITRVVAPGNFNSVSISSVINVTYEKSEVCSVKIMAPSGLMDDVKAEVDGRKRLNLKIDNNGKRNVSYNNIRVKITSPEIKKVKVNGASSFTALPIGAPGGSLSVEVAGASSLNLALAEMAELDLEISGASSANIKSRDCSKVEAEVSGASKLNFSGSAVELSVDVSGCSNVALTGTAAEVDLEASGMSNIEAGDLKAKTGKADASGMSNITCNIDQRPSVSSSGMSKVRNKAK